MSQNQKNNLSAFGHRIIFVAVTEVNLVTPITYWLAIPLLVAATALIIAGGLETEK
ncbi:MAG: hypothetical protein GYA86_03845 [Firmicutes bacterium]|nr:hypothetical protein [Bacillota bacterium]